MRRRRQGHQFPDRGCVEPRRRCERLTLSAMQERDRAALARGTSAPLARRCTLCSLGSAAADRRLATGRLRTSGLAGRGRSCRLRHARRRGRGTGAARARRWRGRRGGGSWSWGRRCRLRCRRRCRWGRIRSRGASGRRVGGWRGILRGCDRRTERQTGGDEDDKSHWEEPHQNPMCIDPGACGV
jgi:hypothetical protein